MELIPFPPLEREILAFKNSCVLEEGLLVPRKRSRGVWPITVSGDVKQYKMSIKRDGEVFLFLFDSSENKFASGGCCHQSCPVEMH